MLKFLLSDVLRMIKDLKIHGGKGLLVEVEDALTDEVFVLRLNGILTSL